MSEFTAAYHTAVAQLTGSGAPFEVTDTPRSNYFVKSYRNAEPNLRSVMTPGRQFGDALFLEYLDQKWTFNQFFKAVDALAGHLQTVCGVQPGDRVAIAMRNRPEWLVAFVAIVECAGVAVPLNSWGKTQELQQGLEDSAAGVVVCDSPRFNFIRAADIDVTTLLVDAEPTDEPDYHWRTALQAQLSATPVDAEPSDPAILLFTSGTAGNPKGALFTHTNACQALMNIELIGAATYMTNTDAMNRQMGSGTPAKTLLAVPLFHISGLFSQFIINLRHGRGLYLMYKWDAKEALRLVRESGITVLMGAPTMLLDLLGREDATPADFSAIANVSAGGADTPPLLHDLYRRQIHESLAGAGWGLTESGGQAPRSPAFMRMSAPARRASQARSWSFGSARSTANLCLLESRARCGCDPARQSPAMSQAQQIALTSKMGGWPPEILATSMTRDSSTSAAAPRTWCSEVGRISIPARSRRSSSSIPPARKWRSSRYPMPPGVKYQQLLSEPVPKVLWANQNGRIGAESEWPHTKYPANGNSPAIPCPAMR